MPSIKGTSSVSSTRALEKALKRTKFPACFSQRVDLAKINRPVLTQWIEKKIDELLGFEDEIVQSTAVNLFLPVAPEDSSMQPAVDPRTAQLDLAGFLSEEGSANFAEELWQLMLDAQEQAMGIPRKIVEEKKKELELQQQLADAANVHLPPIRPPHAAPPRQSNQYNQSFPQRPLVRPVSPRHYNDGDWRRDDVRRDHHHEAPVPLNDQGQSKSDEFGRSIPVPQPPLRTEARGSSSHRDDSRRRGDSRVHREGRRDDDSDRRRRDYRHDDRRGEASRRRHRSRSSSPGRNRHVRRRQSHSSSASSSTSSSASYSSTSSSGSSSRSRGGSRGR